MVPAKVAARFKRDFGPVASVVEEELKVTGEMGQILLQLGPFTLWLFNIAMENGPFIDVFE